MNPVLVAAKQRRKANQEKLDQIVAVNRSLSPTESAEFYRIADEINDDDVEIERLQEEDQRRNRSGAAAKLLEGRRGTYITSEPMTYDVDSRGDDGVVVSFFRDLAVAEGIGGSHFGAQRDAAVGRLAQHRKEMDIEARGNAVIARALEELRMTPRTLRERESRVAPNTTAGTGGEFVPPLWALDLYAGMARGGRVCANRIPSHPLPGGVDVINIPKITTGSTVVVQPANAAPVSSTDIATATVSANVNTLAGMQDISMQLLEQSPISMDTVIFDDLSRDYDRSLDRQVVFGSGTNGQHLGVLSQTAASANSTTSFNTDITKANAVTCASTTFWDGTTATSFTQYRSMANAITNIETLRFERPTAIWGHPRRVNSWSLASDSTNGRPLFVQYGPYNALGRAESGPVPEGVAGELLGLPVVKDPNIPITCATGAITGGTGDVIAVVREDDMILYEGVVRLRALPEVLSGTLQVRFQLYNYSAFFPHRFPASTTIITGTTGLAVPAW